MKEGDSDALANARSATYELIGRNVALYQRLEHILKALLPRVTVTAYAPADSPKDRTSDLENRKSAVQGATLGNLITRYEREICNLDEPEIREDPKEINLLRTLRRGFNSSADREAHIAKLRQLVADRNHLIHQLFAEETLRTPGDWHSTYSKLEEQAKKIESVNGDLLQYFKAIRIANSALSDPKITKKVFRNLD
ncbi:hypothetical protein [Haloferula sp.]|uniref:hypothetical protein n=1 Tax=Haloferula sp. TaxID=2497595 RepID=UPI00329E4A31